ncbi:Uncharacterised protein [Listeria monocytogenes]|nr:hypothetical protein FORC67_0079 [Listeria monocytogenes]QQP67866.1 hypothetical protein I8J47_01437 [Listeria monocytogenes]RKA18737.1 hypothetical protein DYZ84_01109 [Listeria monocytogenes]CWU59621.1 Uncharacterised protein [Listeria monocytogenes]CWU96252.1 Uncharacterised protein [Listeria monocytogenes]
MVGGLLVVFGSLTPSAGLFGITFHSAAVSNTEFIAK